MLDHQPFTPNVGVCMIYVVHVRPSAFHTKCWGLYDICSPCYTVSLSHQWFRVCMIYIVHVRPSALDTKGFGFR